ncbi:MAG: hypothetical protein L0Y36_01200 [Planctomycetales bacterium]|nr:hypothetical protein [Planctomycetales bacterium]
MTTLPLANAVLPLFFGFYFGMIFFCIIVVPLEAYIFKKLERVTFFRILPYIFFANIVSWILGLITSAPIMNMIEFHKFSSDPDKNGVLETFFAFIVAFILSWFIEYIFLRFFSKHFSFSHLFKTTCYANMLSYLTIYVIVFGWIIIEGLLS